MNKEALISKIKTDLLGVGAILFFIFVIANSETCTKAVLNGLSLSFGFLVPSLFFSMVITGIIRETGILRRLPFINNRWEIIILSLLGGYPICSVLSSKSLDENLISKEEAVLLNNCFLCGGPAFLIGGLGVKLLGNRRLGFFIYLSSVISGLIIYVFSKKPTAIKNTKISKPNFAEIITTPVENTSRAVIKLSAFVTLFSAISYILSGFSEYSRYLSYFLEVTSAVSNLGTCKVSSLSISLLAFFTSFGGICVGMQVFSNLNLGVFSKTRFFLYRIFSGLLSAVLVNIFLKLFPQSISVSINLAAPANFSSNIPASIFLIIFAFFTVFSLEKIKLKRINYH